MTHLLRTIFLTLFFALLLGSPLRAQNFKEADHEYPKITVTDMYPNPASASAYLNYELKDRSAQAEVVIYDILGTTVAQQKLDPSHQRVKLDVSGLTNGVYLYSINVNGKSRHTKRLVIRH